MTVSRVRIRLLNTNPADGKRLKAIASITLDDQLIINDIKVIQGKNRMCIEFPKHQFAKVSHLEYIVPLNHSVRSMLETSILDAFHEKADSARKACS